MTIWWLWFRVSGSSGWPKRALNAIVQRLATGITAVDARDFLRLQQLGPTRIVDSLRHHLAGCLAALQLDQDQRPVRAQAPKGRCDRRSRYLPADR